MRRKNGSKLGAILTVAMITLGAGSSLAAPIDYTVSGTATFVGAMETLSGSFTYDPTTKIQSNAFLVLTGGPYSGTFADAAPGLGNGMNIAAPLAGLPAVNLVFSNLLSSGSDALTGVYYLTQGSLVPANSVSGVAAPSTLTLTPTPEPSTLMVVALGGLCLTAVRRRKVRKAG